MTPFVFLAILLAAALHAGWNAVVKSGVDKRYTPILVASSAAFISAFALPFIPVPKPSCWLFIGASVMFQGLYFLLLGRSYRLADMSLAYPLMRGAAPVVTAVVSVAFLGELLSAASWFALIAICSGITLIALHARGRMRIRAVAIALLNAIVIAAYTLIDGLGVRRSGAPVSYALWLILLTGLSLLIFAICTSPRDFLVCVGRSWARG